MKKIEKLNEKSDASKKMLDRSSKSRSNVTSRSNVSNVTSLFTRERLSSGFALPVEVTEL